MQTGLEQAFHVDGSTVFDQEYWNRFVRELATRFRGLDDIKISWDEVSRQGIDVALERINNAIGPAAERIRRLTELGFLVASSETPATLAAGTLLSLEVTAGDARDLFTPSPYLLLGRTQSADDYAVAKLRGYNRETGLLELDVVTVAGDPGPHEDWSIGALAGSTVAQLVMLEQGRQVLANMIGARDQVFQARDQADTSRRAAQAAEQAATLRRDDTTALRDQAKTSRDQVADLKDETAGLRNETKALRDQAAAISDQVNGPLIAASIKRAEQRAIFFNR